MPAPHFMSYIGFEVSALEKTYTLCVDAGLQCKFCMHILHSAKQFLFFS